MWVSKVDDLMTSEKKDNVQINNPMSANDNLNHLRSPMTSKRASIVHRVLNLSDLRNDNAVVVSLSQKRIPAASTYAAALSGVDESLFMAD